MSDRSKQRPWVALASSKACQWWPVSLLALFVVAGISFAASQEAARKPAQKIIALHLLPESLTLTDARDVQHVLVIGETDSHHRIDLSPSAAFTPTSDLVSVSTEGAVKPLKPGQTQVTITAAGLTAALPVTIKSAATTE